MKFQSCIIGYSADGPIFGVNKTLTPQVKSAEIPKNILPELDLKQEVHTKDKNVNEPKYEIDNINLYCVPNGIIFSE
jgi:hypothetical protein